MLTFDFETEAIVGNPIFSPPQPVGVSIKQDDGKSHYWAWGHPAENNCSWAEGRAELITALKKDPVWLAHNSPFEAAITKKYFKLVKGNAKNFHDTQYLIFLSDPYAATVALKPAAERILDWPPEEQDELKSWILRNVPAAKESDWGAYISLAPGGLVGRYAEGDTDRTYALFQRLSPEIRDAGMWGAYERELELAPILSETSARGIRLDQESIFDDIKIYRAAQKVSDEYIFSRLGEFEISKDAQLADALDRAGQITEWVLTPTGKRSTARKNLVGRVRDPAILEHLAYRGVLETCLGTFAESWLAQSGREQGRLHPQWNQVRGDRGADGDLSGTRTGRMSCRAPNFQNVPNDFEGLAIPKEIKKHFAKSKKNPILHLRQYLLPEEGHVWAKRDFSAQEMRILAHFSEGKLYDAFHENPATDPHEAVRKIILEFSGLDLPRKLVKITGFGILYGRGVDNLAIALGVDRNKAQDTRNAYYSALPEVRWLADETRQCGRIGQPIRTWGGRLYYREPNPERDLSYKLLNYLIQGSAADQTKQATIDWHANKRPGDLLLADVHDEMNISVPADDWQPGMVILREQMNLSRFDVPFLSEGFVGPNWADIKECE